jgi:DNA (cytosine-5)-methyltransferase 1
MRNKVLKVRLSDEENASFQDKCRQEKISPAVKTRELILDFANETTQNLAHLASNEVCPSLPSNGTFTVAEMFSGPGGIGTALNRTKTKHYHFEHAWATDYDADTMRTYKANVLKGSEAPFFLSDVRKLDIDSLPAADGFLYGFPCNDFSLVGESKGLDGHFGGLFSYGVRYINRVNPLFFFAENVSGLSSANDGKAFKLILSSLNHAGLHGYNITANLYKFEEYGVPQARHRYIIIGVRGDLGLRFEVPKPSGKIKTCSEAINNPPIGADAHNNEITRQSATVVQRLNLIRPGENVWEAEDRLPPELRLNVKGARLSQIYRRLHPDQPAYTVTGSGGGGTHVYHWSEPRALTNRERARLQTFPDDFIFYGSKESVRKQIGMAVPCDGAQVILKALLDTFEGRRYSHVAPSVGYYPAKTFDPDK